jgi:hypothetical protein
VVLLYKDKGSPLDLPNYRPIGLHCTLYKLWTRFITTILYDFSESNNILTSSQAGFRKYTNTMQNVQLLISALEDSHLFNNNLFLLQVDFSSAFNMVDHDKLLQIMFDLASQPTQLKSSKISTQTRILQFLPPLDPHPQSLSIEVLSKVTLFPPFSSSSFLNLFYVG